MNLNNFAGMSQWWALAPFIVLGLIGLYLDRKKTNHRRPPNARPPSK